MKQTTMILVQQKDIIKDPRYYKYLAINNPILIFNELDYLIGIDGDNCKVRFYPYKSDYYIERIKELLNMDMPDEYIHILYFANLSKEIIHYQ